MMSYWRCKFCGKPNPDDGWFCDALHASAWRTHRLNLIEWLHRTTILMDAFSPQEWEYDHTPLGEADAD